MTGSMNRTGRRMRGLAGVACGAGLLLAVGQAWAQGGAVFSQEEICKQKFQTGQEYLRNNRLHDAATAFSEVKEACPAMIDAYLNLVYIQTQLAQYQEAIATCEDALDQDPTNLDVKESMAFAMSSAGELEDAIALYLELHRARPEKADIVKNLAFVYEKKGDVAEAVMLYDRLIEIGQADPAMVTQAGRMALDNKLYFPAVTFYKKLYEFNPGDVATLGILGGYYYKIKFYGEAIPYYEKILEIDPQHTQSLMFHKILIDCYKREKRLEEAARHAELVLAQEPNDVTNYCNLAFIYKDAQNPAKVTEVVRRGLEVDANADCLWYALGLGLELEAKALETMKRYEEAIRTLEEAKGKFQRVIELGGRYASYGRQQLERMDQLIERLRSMQEREENQ